MNKGKELIQLDDPKNIIEFLRLPAVKLGEFITGLLVSDTKDYKLSAGHLVQASIKCNLYSQLGNEIKDYIKKGKIKEDFLDKEINKQTLADLLKFIDETSPGENRFNAMKTLFFKSVSSDSSQEDQVLSYQFMKLCKSFESNDLLILKAAHDINDKNLHGDLKLKKIDLDSSAHNWLTVISQQIGHGILSLVEVNEDKLINLKLIGPRTMSDKSGITNWKRCRLTDLGSKICEFLYGNNL